MFVSSSSLYGEMPLTRPDETIFLPRSPESTQQFKLDIAKWKLKRLNCDANNERFHHKMRLLQGLHLETSILKGKGVVWYEGKPQQ